MTVRHRPVRACFYCESVKESFTHGEDHILLEVLLRPVVSGLDNVDWSKYTPHGELRLTITNPACKGQFILGHHYHIDIAPAVAEAVEAA